MPRKKTDFVHLHVHTEYSLLDGLTKIKPLVQKVKELGMKSIAITDHGVMYGAIEFYKECLKNDIKPIIGCEAYLAPNGRTKKTPDNRQNLHLVLLAKNKTGYKNLMKLVSLSHLEGFYYKPRIDWELLDKYHEGLICNSGCIEGIVAYYIMENNKKKAIETAKRLLDIFGEDFYLEIQKHPGLKGQEKANQGLVEISRKLGIPLVAANDSHYLRKEDAFAQDVLLMINTQTTINDKNRLSLLDVPDFYIKSPEEMAEQFKDFPDALENTVKIAEKCNLEIKLGDWNFPPIDLPKGETAETHLKKKTYQGAEEHYGKPLTQEVIDRLEYELEIICQKGYAPYFLIMRKFIEWTENNDTVTNTRGSAAGSLVSFVMGITSVDPLIYELPFERFLNRKRPSPPDIDLDVSDDKRQEMLHHIIEDYGEKSVAQICTFGRMLARGSVRDTARVLGYEYSVGDKISKLIPLGSQGFPMTIDRALKESTELKSLYENDSDAQKILDTAKEIEGSARHISVHACALVISPTTINDYSPTQRETGGDKIITQYEMHAIEDVGLIKLDVLGIRNLSILGNAVVNVKKTRNKEINLRKIPLDDRKTFKMLSKGHTMGVFQLGGKGMTDWVKKLQPNRVEDLMAMVALYRPGPMAIIPEYIARKENPDKVDYLDPRMEQFLEKSYGLLVYQDDCLYTAIELAGYNWVEADKFRKAIGKKIPEEMEKQKEKFIQGCIKNGLSKKQAQEIFGKIEPFVGYGFNKAHAASYGMLAYRTGYMKANYPVEYMCALLTAEAEDLDKVGEAIKECRRMGIIIKPPDINLSDKDFRIEKDEKSLDGRAIRFGINAIKNVGTAAIEEIISAREEGEEFASLTDFCMKVCNRKINKKVLESLIKAGAMDCFGKRKALLLGLENIRQLALQRQKQAENGQVGLFAANKQAAESHKPIDRLPSTEEFSQQELLRFEKELLGIYLTEHPLEEKLSALASVVSHKADEVQDLEKGKARIGGIINQMRVINTRKSGKEMAFVSVEDETGNLELVVFPKIYEESRQYLEQEKVIVASVKIEQREERQSLIAQKIVSLQKIEERGNLAQKEGFENNSELDFMIRIPKGTSPHKLIELNSLLKNHPGNKKGRLIFPNGKEVDIPIGIDWTEQLEKTSQKILDN